MGQKLVVKGLKVILTQGVRNTSLFGCWWEYQVKVKWKGRGEQGTVVAGHRLGLATERKAQPDPGKASTTVVLKCRGWPLKGVTRW